MKRNPVNWIIQVNISKKQEKKDKKNLMQISFHTPRQAV